MATEAEYTIAKTARDDIKAVYLHAFDSFATTPSDVADSVESISNIRYARELIGVLTNQSLLTVQDVNGEEDVWQVANPGTYDDHTREEAEQVINEWLDKAMPLPEYNPNHNVNNPNRPSQKEKSMNTTTATPKAKPAPKEITFHKCGCGCDANIAGKAMYKPGHDARHAGEVARQIVAARPQGRAALDALLAVLPTDALQRKAEGLADLWIAKADAKQKREDERLAKAAAKQEAKPEWTDTEPVTVGKVTYPARLHRDGVTVERNSKKDGSGKWVAVKTA